MSLKKLGVAVLAVVVLGAIATNSAFAAEFEESGATWFVGGAALPVGTHEAFQTEAKGEKQTLETTVAGQQLDLTWSKTSCIGCFIDNTAGTIATLMGSLSTTVITVSNPAGCSVKGGSVETKPLSVLIGMKLGSATVSTAKFTPEEGSTFATVTLEGSGCPIAGTYKITGTQFAEALSATGTSATSQDFKMNKAIQEAAGGSLKFGENGAIVTDEFKGTLTSGKAFKTEK